MAMRKSPRGVRERKRSVIEKILVVKTTLVWGSDPIASARSAAVALLRRRAIVAAPTVTGSRRVAEGVVQPPPLAAHRRPPARPTRPRGRARRARSAGCSACGSIALQLARTGAERLAGGLHGDAARIHPRHAVPREEAVDGDRGADLERVAPPAAALKLMRRAELRAPVRDLPAVGIANVEVDPDMRIRPFDFSDDAVELDRLVGIELRG